MAVDGTRLRQGPVLGRPFFRVPAGLGLALLILAFLCLAVMAACFDPSAPNPYKAVSGLSVAPSSLNVYIGRTRLLSATVSPTDATNRSVSWASDDSAVAAVDEAGLVTAVSAGVATITATAADGGKTASCAVTVREPDVYVGGSYQDVSSILHPGYWKNGAWIELDPGTAGESAEVLAICAQDGDVYAAGYSNDGGLYVPGYWKNGLWNALPIPAGEESRGFVNSILVSGADVHAAGPLFNPVTSNWDLVGYWKNGELTTYQLVDNNSDLVDLCLNDGDVYITSIDCHTSIHTSGYWKNGDWTLLPAFVDGKDYDVKTIAVVGGQVLAAGYSYYGGTPDAPRAVLWVDGEVSALEPEILYESQAFDLAYSGNDIYIAGWYNASDDAPDMSCIPCYWKNGGLVPLDKTGDDILSGVIETGTWIAVTGNLVFVAGEIQDTIDGGSVPFVWRDGVRNQLETQDGNLYHNVRGVALD